MHLVAETATRVTANTASEINRRIEQETDRRVVVVASQGRAAIEARLRELDREWDVERCLETGASTLVLTGALLGATSDKK